MLYHCNLFLKRKKLSDSRLYFKKVYQNIDSPSFKKCRNPQKRFFTCSTFYIIKMRKIVIVCFILGISCFCSAQNDWKRISDSLSLKSRAKADIVLSMFDTLHGKKILYSLQDRYYYIVFQLQNSYKEYVIEIDSICNVMDIEELDDDKKIEELKAKKGYSGSCRKLLKQLEEDRQTISDAFDISQYSTEFITSMTNATFIAGVPSYFVMKDENDKRYGEYSLSSMTFPCPMNPILWICLNRKLMKIDY